MSIRGRKALPIGVDIGSSTVKMAQLGTSGSDVELLALGLAEIPRPCRDDFSQRLKFLSDSIRRIRKANAFRGRECVLSLPAEATFVQQVKLPKVPPEQIDKALQEELPYPVDDAILRHEVVGSIHDGDEPKQELIVAAVAKATLDAYLDMARHAKVDVVGVDIEAFAIADCFARQFRQMSDVPRVVLFVDLGAASTQVVFTHDNKVVFARNLSMGCEQLDQTVADGSGMAIEDAGPLLSDIGQAKTEGSAADDSCQVLDGALDPLMNELSQCLRYHDATFKNSSVDLAIFVGGGGHDVRICRTIAGRLDLRAQIGDPLAGVGRAKEAGLSAGLNQHGPKPDWAVAVGLSLRATRKAEETAEQPVAAETRR